MGVFGLPAGDWRRGANFFLALAALLAVVLAPLELCCLRGHSGASNLLSLELSLGPAAHVALCADRDDGGGPQDHAPGQAHHEACPCCHLVNTAALDPALAPTTAAYPKLRAETLTAPEILGAAIRPPALTGRPRAPPHLI